LSRAAPTGVVIEIATACGEEIFFIMAGKDGLKYFPVDVGMSKDDKILLAKELVDPDGKDPFLRFCVPYVAIRLLEIVYENGYYIEWNDGICRLLADNIGNGATMKTVQKIVEAFLYSKFLSRDMFTNFKILTSRGIQRRWYDIMILRRLSKREIKKEYLLLEESYSQPAKPNKTQKNSSSEKNGISSEKNGISSEKSAISSRRFESSISFNKNTIEDKDRDITLEEYSDNINKYIEKEKEKEDSSEKNGISSEKNGISSEKNGISSEKNGISSEEIELDAVDLQMLKDSSDEFKESWKKWINYNWQQNGKKYKSLVAKRQAVDNLVMLSGKVESVAIEIIDKTITNCWKIFYSLDNQDSVKYNGSKKEDNGIKIMSGNDPIEEQRAHYARRKRD